MIDGVQSAVRRSSRGVLTSLRVSVVALVVTGALAGAALAQDAAKQDTGKDVAKQDAAATSDAAKADAKAAEAKALISEGGKSYLGSAKDAPKPGGACAAYGPGFIAIGSADLCLRSGATVIGYASKEFTGKDIELVGQRIPTPFTSAAGAPIAYYYLKDVKGDTDNIDGGVIATAFATIRRETEVGTFGSMLRVSLDGRAAYDDDGNILVGMDQFQNTYYMGVVDEAWVQLNGLKIGIQPSMFGFNRLPSVVTPGYTSIVTTAALSLTYAFNPNASFSVAFEDSGRRVYGDGVLARPKGSERPDLVALLRYRTPSTLFHLSGALHESTDMVMADFADGKPRDVTGWAWSAGMQSRIKWEDFLGDEAKGVYGRFGLTVANASGALHYLGIPMFAPDYVVAGTGQVDLSTGWSALVSYEHMLATNLKLMTNYSYFNVTMRSPSESLMPVDPNAPLQEFDFSVNTQGSVFQVGLEYIPAPMWALGLEGGYTWTESKGKYVDEPGNKVQVGFPHVGVYARRSF